MRYIGPNPVASGMAALLGDYTWLHYQANTHGIANPLIIVHSLCRRLAWQQEERLAFHCALFKAPMDQQVLDAIARATQLSVRDREALIVFKNGPFAM